MAADSASHEALAGLGGAALLRDELAALRRLAQRCCWSEHDADDAVQRAMLIALQLAGNSPTGPARLRWMRTVVVRQAVECNRRRARTRRAETVRAIRDAGALGAEDAAQREQTQRMRLLLERLPERQRIAVVLRHLEELPYEDVAEIMEITQSTARVLVRDGRERLRVLLSEGPD